MTLSFALTAVMTAVVLSIVLAFVWEQQFQTYTRDNMQRMATQMADTLSQQYADEGAWTDSILDYVDATSGSMKEVGIRLIDSDGNVLYDNTMGGLLVSRQGRQSKNVILPPRKDSVVVADIQIVDVLEDGTTSPRVVGSLTFWAMNSDVFLTQSDSLFRTSSYGAIVTAASMAVIFACIIGVFVARALAKPIKVITTTASQIRNGDLTARTGISGTDEIGRLGETIDDMATTLERDIKLEHRLTSDVAHELRTPLMAMQATVEAMQDGVLPADQTNLATVGAEVRRLSRLVDAMLRLSRMENGKTPFQLEKCDVVELASNLVVAHSQLFQDNGIELTLQNDTGHDAFYAEIDPDLIREAMVNLLSNAMRYTAEGGSVTVRVARDRRNVLLSVQDTGMGIAKEDIPRVFSRFWRSDASRERVAGGLGVGLSLTKEIVDRHNGTISVDSEEGVGTTFTLHLPVTHRKTR
ncbi:MAG: HAMP domain-containing histidine kinase [Atopobiaceae bacterium]|nr:HAMP domain-containing histidine kinase [Atopobiaceae bacterium]